MANEAKYVVELTSEERSLIKRMLSKGKAAAYKQRHGRILLLTDQGPHGGKKMSDPAIAQAIACGQATVERIRKCFVLEGFEVALGRKNRTNYQRKIDGKAEAHLIALTCSKVPEDMVAGHSDYSRTSWLNLKSSIPAAKILCIGRLKKRT